jgi:hypothetical protein
MITAKRRGFRVKYNLDESKEDVQRKPIQTSRTIAANRGSKSVLIPTIPFSDGARVGFLLKSGQYLNHIFGIIQTLQQPPQLSNT